MSKILRAALLQETNRGGRDENLDAIEVGVTGLQALRNGHPPTEAIEYDSMTLYLQHIQSAWDAAHPGA